MLTKSFILNYFKKFFTEHGKIPKSKDSSHPFSNKPVIRLFGSWSDALKAAELPCNRYPSENIKCNQCNKITKKSFSDIKKYKNHYCSRSCSAIYNNTHKKLGVKVSKLELYLQSQLKGYEFSFNNRDVCDGLELDIYIPKLNIGIEINGVFHYKPIFGDKKLEHIMKKDKEKYMICKKKNIKLYIIKDTSNKFSIKYGQHILHIIYHIIHKHHYDLVLHELNNLNLFKNNNINTVKLQN
jgi:hypothetical protein